MRSHLLLRTSAIKRTDWRKWKAKPRHGKINYCTVGQPIRPSSPITVGENHSRSPRHGLGCSRARPVPVAVDDWATATATDVADAENGVRRRTTLRRLYKRAGVNWEWLLTRPGALANHASRSVGHRTAGGARYCCGNTASHRPTDRTPATVVSFSGCSPPCSIRLDASVHTTSTLEYFVERDRSFNIYAERARPKMQDRNAMDQFSIYNKMLSYRRETALQGAL